jgi:crotonobetainyl-CoA:carnitine CoA-transferase CaiB-like acyl-CoA transferase
MRPDAISRLRLTFEDIRASKSDIVYCNLYGFGRNGVYAGRAAYDDTIQALCGLASLEAVLHGEPAYVPSVVADKVSALTGVYAVAFALFYRAKTGEGQEVDVAMFETMASFTLAEHMVGAAFVPPLGPPLYARATDKLRRPYRTKDGYLSVLVYTNKQFRRFVEIVGRPDLRTDLRFAGLNERIKNVSEYYALIQNFVAERTSAEWLEVLEKAGIPVARVNSTADLLHDPHLLSVNFFESVIDPKGGEYRLPGRPFRFSAAPNPELRPAPELGEHTREIMSELGLSESEICALEDMCQKQ